MKKSTTQTQKHILGIILILIAIALVLYDFFSPPVGELSNFTLIIFAKFMAVAGSLMNLNLKDSSDDKARD